MGGKDVMHAILRVSILTHLYLTASTCSAFARAAAPSMAAYRSRTRADDNGCALSAERVIFFKLSVEEATSLRHGTYLFRGCTTLT